MPRTQIPHVQIEGQYLPLVDSVDGKLNKSWLAFLWTFAMLCTAGAVAMLVVGIITLVDLNINNITPYHWAAVILLIISSVAFGILNPISVAYASKGTAKFFAVSIMMLLLFNIVCLILVVQSDAGFAPVMTGGVAIILQIVFFTLYAPMVLLKNLQKTPTWCAGS